MKTDLLCLAFAAIAAAQANLPPLASGNVTIPVAEYNRMVDLAEQASKKPAAAPRTHVIRSAEMQMQVDKGIATGVLEIRGEVLQKGPTGIALGSGLHVRDAQNNGRPIPLAIQGAKHSTVIEGPGEFAIQIACSMPVTNEPGRASIAIPALSAGIVKLQASIPGEETVVQVSPGFLSSRSSAAGRTDVKAVLLPGKASVLSWNARMPPPAAAPVKPLRFLSDVKTSISAGESGLGMNVLADVTVLQGETAMFDLTVPDGFAVTSATGATLSMHSLQGSRLKIGVTNPIERSHQFLITLAKANQADRATVSLPGFAGSQRETGELLIESQGALELAAKESGGLRRMDLRELSPQLRALADESLQAAFRYQRRESEAPAVALEWVRWAAAPLTSALSSRATATTLVTREGRSLTEIRITVQNQSQAFVRVGLPPGASILTAEVAGEKVKPVVATDGNRVPLLRPGFRPAGPYVVSFVIVHAGVPFAKKGAGEVNLPKLDLPVAAIEWEVFLPTEFRVANFGGDVFPEDAMPHSADSGEPPAPVARNAPADIYVGPGQIGGAIIDPTGASISGALITVTHEAGQIRKAVSSHSGTWVVAGLPPGQVTINATSPGFRSTTQIFDLRSLQPLSVTLRLDLGSIAESVEVSSASEALRVSQENERLRRQNAASQRSDDAPASANVLDLQKRLSGVLPVSISIPRTGRAFRFVRPLVVDEETKLSFQYRASK